MQPARTIKQNLEDGSVVAGALLSNHLWPESVEVARDAGLDYLVVDMEHGPHTNEMVAQVCELGRIANFAILIRPAANDFRTISMTMDLGPCGLLLATVESAEALDEVRDALYLPPRGRRRPGGLGNRWVDDFRYQTWKQTVENHVIVVPQIETIRGLENVEAIAAHEITTAIGIGPYDLSMALEIDCDHAQPSMVNAINRIRQAGESAGKTMWRIGDPTKLVGEGFRFVCMGDPMALLTDTWRQKIGR